MSDVIIGEQYTGQTSYQLSKSNKYRVASKGNYYYFTTDENYKSKSGNVYILGGACGYNHYLDGTQAASNVYVPSYPGSSVKTNQCNIPAIKELYSIWQIRASFCSNWQAIIEDHNFSSTLYNSNKEVYILEYNGHIKTEDRLSYQNMVIAIHSY